MTSSRDAPSVVDAPVGPKRGRPPRPGPANGGAPLPAPATDDVVPDGDDDGGAPWPAPATDDGVPNRDDGGVVAVVDATDAACAVGPGPGAAAEAAAPSVPRKRGRPPLNAII
jgi:hypothetical protein